MHACFKQPGWGPARTVRPGNALPGRGSDNMTGRGFAGLLLAVFVTMAGADPAAGAPSKVAVMDMEAALKAYHKTAKADAEIERQKAEYKAELGRMKKHQDELDGQFESARAAASEAGLDEKTLQERLAAAEEKLMQVKEYERQAAEFAEKGRKQIQEQSLRIRNQLKGEIQECVRKLAAKEGLALVVDTSFGVSEWSGLVVFRDEAIDITGRVIELLNPKEPGKKSE